MHWFDIVNWIGRIATLAACIWGAGYLYGIRKQVRMWQTDVWFKIASTLIAVILVHAAWSIFQWWGFGYYGAIDTTKYECQGRDVTPDGVRCLAYVSKHNEVEK